MIQHLTLEICKKLKEADFPQADNRYYFCGTHSGRPEEYRIEEGRRYNWLVDAFSGELCACPTADELIDANKYFKELKRDSEFLWIAIAHGVWPHTQAVGNTPAEAVANLWLVLHPSSKAESPGLGTTGNKVEK